MQSLKSNITEILIEGKRVNREQLEKALAIQREKHIPLRKILIEQGIISEEDLIALLSEQLYIPILHINKYKFEQETLKLIPKHIASQYNVVALSRIGNTMTVAMSDPLNVFAIDDLSALTGCNIDIVLSPEEEITKIISTQYGSEVKDAQKFIDEISLAQLGLEKKDIELIKQEELELTSAVEESQKPPIVKLVDLMLTQALNKRASDIHIEPEQNYLRVRYRVDGSLHEIFKIPKKNQNAVLARLKIISNLDITENRVPQDGRFKVKFESREIDFRVSSLPTTFGQKFVLRLLDKSNLSIGLDKLGFSEQPLNVFKEAIAKPFGMLLITGPTGSGKSTTLYSILNQLNTPERNIITVEDPVEYQVEGITQIQVKTDIGFNFAAGLRAILRQSPDIIMIGEIRDSETADIAIKASLTGQLLLSTLHTNDAISSITRIIDMGVDCFLVASSLVMLCAQRLARKVCLKCRKPIEIPREFLKEIGFEKFLQTAKIEWGKDMAFFKADGCKYCNNTGFFGRIAILESVAISDPIREMIMKKTSIDAIRRYVVEECGFRALRDDAFLKVTQGLTTLEEALRITTEE